MRKGFIFVFLLLIIGYSEAQEAFRDPARFKALGNASVSLQSPLSVFSNPAGISTENEMAFGILYESRFLLQELSTKSAFWLIPLANVPFSFSFSQFGEETYHENKFSLAVAKQLADRLHVGIQFHYVHLFLAENDQRPGAGMVDFGIQYELKNDFWIGAQLFNPYEIEIQQTSVEFSYPRIIRLGAHKTFQKLLLVATELKKYDSSPVYFSCGMEVKIKEQFQARLGVETQWSSFSIGMGYTFRQFQTDLAFSYHQYLGYTPSFTLYYQLP